MSNDYVSSKLSQLEEADYNRERTDPQPGESLYLHLSDLALALQPYRTDDPLSVLDFGCGGSPYRSFFRNSQYQRADLPEMPGIDYQIDSAGQVNAPDAKFDLVLSTQVLEHCPDPALYLGEARRVLKKGGRLLLTTHGVFPDHGCPYDFLRWTSDGLERELRRAGFTVRVCQKLTTNGRALAFLNEYHRYWLRGPRRTFMGFFYWLQSLLFAARRGKYFHRWCDQYFASSRVVSSKEQGDTIYIALLVEATRDEG